MSRIRPPENLEIAALRKKQVELHDPLTPGPGTPWEDRGTHGPASAFFKTVGMSLLSPGKLATAIRRPETTGDASGFLIGCAVCWAISVIIHGLIFLHRRPPDTRNISYLTTPFVENMIIAAVAAGVATWALLLFYNLIYGKLVAQEKNQNPLPDSLLYNINAYALGPSLLAVIPFAGPPLALLWIAIDLIAAGRARLRLRVAPAIIDALIPLVAIAVICIVAYFIGHLLLDQVNPTIQDMTPPSPGS